MDTPHRKRIGEILFERGYISQVQLKEALRRQEILDSRPLGQILLELGFITQEQLDQALAVQV